jgi:hypothetical protein
VGRVSAGPIHGGAERIDSITHGVEASMSTADTSPAVQLVPGNTLITRTPDEGRHLAVKMARLIIKTTQPDAAVRERLRPATST